MFLNISIARKHYTVLDNKFWKYITKYKPTEITFHLPNPVSYANIMYI